MKIDRWGMIVGSLLIVVLLFASFATFGVDAQKWVEYGDNPIFGGGVGGPKAYYPSVLYDPDGFGGGAPYRMWYGTSGGRTGLSVSNDGINWTDLGVVMDGGYHATVERFADGFPGMNSGGDPSGDTMHYRMWYWDTSFLYDVKAIGYAESPDGESWHNYQPLSNGAVPIVSGVWPDWNRGSYGPCDVLYNPTATNTGTDWTYTLYYDGTTGGTESIGIGFSSDGVTWTGLDTNSDGHSDPALSGTFIPGDWDYDFTSRATIIKRADGSYEMWYSGGDGAVNNGIGYAFSLDGKTWVRDVDNPIFYMGDGVSWRDKRTYCPMVVFDPEEGIYKMWFTGKDSAGNYSIGYAVGGPVPTEVWVDDDWGGPAATRTEQGKYVGYNAFYNLQSGIDNVKGDPAHTVNVRPGTYDDPVSIDDGVSIVGDSTASSPPVINGDVSINGNGVLIGLPLRGLHFNGDLSVGAGFDASSSRINWCDIYGTVRNAGVGTFDARYNYWGTQDEAAVDSRTIGDIDYFPFLPKDADASYSDIQAILSEGIAGDLDSAIELLWRMTRLGQDVDALSVYQDIGGAGAFRSIAPTDRIVLGGAAGGGGAIETNLANTYAIGEVIEGRLTVIDEETGEEISTAAVTLSLIGPDDSSTVVLWGYAYYDETEGMYLFRIDTSGLAPGIYELIFQTNQGDSETVRIDLQAA